MFFFFKQKTAYEMRISDWSSDVGSSDLPRLPFIFEVEAEPAVGRDRDEPQFGFGLRRAAVGRHAMRKFDRDRAETRAQHDVHHALIGRIDRKSTRLNSRH